MSLAGPLLAAGLGALAAAPLILERQRAPMNAEARASAPGNFVRLSRGLTHYQWAGAGRGPVAVCVHGLTTPSFVWRGVIPHLVAMGFRVLSYDLYGRGYSDRPLGRQDTAFFCRQLEELLEDQGIDDDITLLGYSMGGVIGTAFADAHPGRLRHLMLLAPAGMGLTMPRIVEVCARTPVLGDWLFHMAFPRAMRQGIAAEAHLPKPFEEFTDMQRAELEDRGFVRSVLSSLRGALSEDMEPAHRRIAEAGLPVAAIWAGADKTIPLAGLGRLAQWNRGARQEVIDSAGHGLVFSHADEVGRRLRDLLTPPVGGSSPPKK